VSLKQRVGRVTRALMADARRPPFVAPGHYYSPRTSAADVEHAIANKRVPIGIDLRAAAQQQLAADLHLTPPPVNRWIPDQDMFGIADGAILRAMLLHYRPSRLVEIGSGLSTAVVLDLAEGTLPDLDITCVDPYTDRLLSRLRPGDADRITIIPRRVQDLAPEALVEGLRPGDVFFIDSTHVVKPGSDVCWLYLHTLPRIPPGVLVHIHDIFWPFEYLDDWLREGRDWTEAYLLQAFLTQNDKWEIVLFGSWLWHEHPELVPPDLADAQPGSIWLRRRED
jgi:hypothetical protein